jgi:hypothetical protein
MKNMLSVAIALSLLATSCTKENRGADDLFPHKAGVEDNINGGGGNNVANVPAAVQTTFSARYPDATAVQWKQLNDGTFKAEFFRGAVKWQVIFSATGTVLKEEHK